MLNWFGKNVESGITKNIKNEKLRGKKTNTMLVYVDSFLPSAASLTQVCDSSYLQPGRHVVWCLSVVCVLVLFAI